MRSYCLHIADRKREFTAPSIMAILNLTTDSFAVRHGNLTPHQLVNLAEQMVEAGASFLDLGGQSTRPGYTPLSVEEEWGRIAPGLQAIRQALPEVLISIDTFYAEVARRAINCGADIINDISGAADPEMLPLIARARVPYIYTYRSLISLREWPKQLDGLEDVILDPGFGFEKTVEDNYRLLNRLQTMPGADVHPILAGISRKSMIWKPCGITPAEALPGTVAANLVALQQGAAILRVHDVEAAAQTITVYNQLKICSDLNLE